MLMLSFHEIDIKISRHNLSLLQIQRFDKGELNIALRLKAAYFIISICKDDLTSLERESVGTRGRGLGTVGSFEMITRTTYGFEYIHTQ